MDFETDSPLDLRIRPFRSAFGLLEALATRFLKQSNAMVTAGAGLGPPDSRKTHGMSSNSWRKAPAALIWACWRPFHDRTPGFRGEEEQAGLRTA